MDSLLIIAILTSITSVIGSVLVFAVSIKKAKPEAIKASTETNGISADTAGKYRGMLNDEIERRRKAEDERDVQEDACRELSDENMQLRSENRLLRDQIIAAGLRPISFKPERKQ